MLLVPIALACIPVRMENRVGAQTGELANALSKTIDFLASESILGVLANLSS